MAEVIGRSVGSTARRRATTTTTSSSPRSAAGCARPPKTGGFARRSIRSARVALLERLTQVEVFERFLHRAFPGKTRFSIEGLDMLVPILDEVIGEAAESGTRNILIGMAHRGRLNVMAHVLQQAVRADPGGVQGAGLVAHSSARTWRGPVTSSITPARTARSKGGRAMDVVVSMPPNPSHLEAIDPVVEGMARAAGTVVDTPGAPTFDPTRSPADPDSRRRGVSRARASSPKR